ncbi:MAG TPA: hypothetical protein VF808_17520 [Ktedonobacterales bacterium]
MNDQDSPGAAEAVQGELRPIWPAPPSPALTTSRRRATVARIAATVGGLLFFFAAWTPWATALTSGDLRKGASGPQYIYSLTGAELGAPPLDAWVGSASSAFVWWSLLTAAGVILAPLLWQRTQPWLVWVAGLLYAAWAAVSATVLIQTSMIFFQTVLALRHAASGPYVTTLQPYGIPIRIYTATPAFGLYLAWLALVAPLVALVFATLGNIASPPQLRVRPPTVHGEVAPSASQSDTPAPRSLPGIGAVTGGLLLWAFGYFTQPMATLNCAQQPLLAGSCRGLPGYSALPLGLYATRALFDPIAGIWAINGLLLAGAALAIGTLLRREITRTLCSWLSGWVIFALACILIATSGAQQAVHNAASVGLPAGAWRGDVGAVFVYLGLLLVVIGLIPLWAIAIRSAPRRDPPTN